MKKYILALRHFIPHLIGVAAGTGVALFFSLTAVEGILISTFPVLLLEYIAKVREIGLQLEVDRKAQGDIDTSWNLITSPAPRNRGRVAQPSGPESSKPLPLRTTASEVDAPAAPRSFGTLGIKALAFLCGLAVVGVTAYALIYLLLYFFFYP